MKYILQFIIIICINSISAQIRMEGVVMDSTGQVLEFANIIAVNQNTKAIETFTITDKTGFYKLNLNKNTPYSINISYIGMKSVQYQLLTQGVDIENNFKLISDFNLDEVEVVYKIPIKIKGDSLIYDVDSFKNRSDKKLGDVLKRLPGVEINEDGEIKVEGKKVSRIMIEGKKFFDGDTKLATKYIPASVLDKIQVLKNYDQVSMLKNIRDNQENVAINLNLKEGKKQFWFGDISNGGGHKKKFAIHPNLFYYSPFYSMNIILDLNNIGEAPLTNNDLSRFSNGISEINRDNGTILNVSNMNSGALNATYEQFYGASSKFGATNFNVSPKHDWDINGFVIYSKTKTTRLSENFRSYLRTTNSEDIPTQENTTDKFNKDKHFLLTKLNSTYKPNENNQLDYNLLANMSNQDATKNVFSSVLNDISEYETLRNESIIQNISYYYSPNENHVFATELQHFYDNNIPFYETIFSGDMIYPFSDDLGLDINQNSFNLAQNKNIITNKFDAKLDYWYVLNGRSNINLSFGSTLISQNYNSNLFQILDSGDVHGMDNAIVATTNDFSYKFSDYYFGLHYNLKSGIFVLTPGIISHFYRPQNMQRFVRLLPDLNVKAQLKSTENINLGYKIANRFANVEMLAEGLVLNSYNYLFGGNSDLNSPISHNVNLRYVNGVNTLNRKKYMNINLSLNYTKVIESLRSQIEPEGILRISSPINSVFSDHSFIANGSFSKAFGKIVLRANTSFLYANFKQNLNNFAYTNESKSIIYGFGSSSNFKNIPNFEIGYNLVSNTYLLSEDRLKFNRQNPYLKLKGKFLPEFIGSINYSYFKYRGQKEIINDYDMLNADITYQKRNSKWEFKIQLYNILNNKSINEDYTNNFYTNTSTYFTQPRYTLLIIKYNL